jgi:hypothetical protein
VDLNESTNAWLAGRGLQRLTVYKQLSMAIHSHLPAIESGAGSWASLVSGSKEAV